MHLLIGEQGQILGQTFSTDNARRHALVSDIPMFVVCKEVDANQLPAKVKKAISADTSGKAVWKQLKERVSSIRQSRQRVPYWGKVSVKRAVRHLYAQPGAEFSQDELLNRIAGSTWINIVTTFSMLKNAKYADGELMVIELVGEKYQRLK